MTVSASVLAKPLTRPDPWAPVGAYAASALFVEAMWLSAFW